MNIGIIVHSSTGNTLSVANGIMASLISAGHTAEVLRVTALDDDPNTANGKKLKDAPDVSPYDVLIFGAPVWAFSLSSVMRAYLAQLPMLSEKKAGCFVTQQLPRSWMGGNHAIRQMKALCSAKGIPVFNTGIIHWSSKDKDSHISALTQKMGQALYCADIYTKRKKI